MKKAVIFDMDGVLIDSEMFYFNRRMAFFDSIGIEPGTREFKNFIGLSDKSLWEVLVPNDKTKRKELKEKYFNYRKNNIIDFRKVLNKSAKYVIAKLKDNDIKVAIASSSEKQEILRMVKECDLDKYIDFIISGEECSESKPNPEIYNKAIKTLDLLTREVIAVEDSELGIAAAKAANIEVIALEQVDNESDQSGANYIIKDLSELLNLIQNKEYRY